MIDGASGSKEEAGTPASSDERSLVWDILDNARTPAERVAEARRLLALQATYPNGCSDFMSAVLGIPFEQANALMGTSPTSLGSKPPYGNLSPGDVVGWKESVGSGHVALFVSASSGPGYADMFIDVGGPGGKPRSKNGFYNREIFKSSRF